LVNAPFFMLVPNWAQIPMILLATAATIIASQAVITGAYSVATQAARLGYLPRLRVSHTSESSIGQVYVPWINGVLLVGVLILVLAFRSSAALAYAYGMAVTGTIAISTLLFLYVAHIRWRVPVWALVVGGGSLLVVDLMFVAANLTKLLHGAWLPLLVGLIIFTLMTTWQRGQQITAVARDKAEGSLVDFIDDIDNRQPPLPRTAGTGIFLSRGPTTAPLALRATVHHNRALHRSVIIVAIETPPIPRIPDTDRIACVDALGDHQDGIFFVSARFGYMERPNVPDALRLVDPSRAEGGVDVDSASYFLSRLDLSAGPDPGMAPWRKRLYIAISHVATDGGYFGMPLDQTVLIGSRIEI
jgi:KUP system potassium uptake protein